MINKIKVSPTHQNKTWNTWSSSSAMTKRASKTACRKLIRSCSENIPGQNWRRSHVPTSVNNPAIVSSNVK